MSGVCSSCPVAPLLCASLRLQACGALSRLFRLSSWLPALHSDFLDKLSSVAFISCSFFPILYIIKVFFSFLFSFLFLLESEN